ncbi:hypothetical protein C8J57DRAFT_1335415 [Mycena rebaudengoi]|nr:hypothetical protein C8J57DRAFT_1335415 [Mycena rebaudengoi]
MAALHRLANSPFDFLRFPWAKTVSSSCQPVLRAAVRFYIYLGTSCQQALFRLLPTDLYSQITNVSGKYNEIGVYLGTYLPRFYTFERRNSPRSFNSNSLHPSKLQPQSCSSALAVFCPLAARHFMYIFGHCREIHCRKIHRLRCPRSYPSTIFVRTRPSPRIPLGITVLHCAGSRGNRCVLIHMVRRVQCVDVV